MTNSNQLFFVSSETDAKPPECIGGSATSLVFVLRGLVENVSLWRAVVFLKRERLNEAEGPGMEQKCWPLLSF